MALDDILSGYGYNMNYDFSRDYLVGFNDYARSVKFMTAEAASIWTMWGLVRADNQARGVVTTETPIFGDGYYVTNGYTFLLGNLSVESYYNWQPVTTPMLAYVQTQNVQEFANNIQFPYCYTVEFQSIDVNNGRWVLTGEVPLADLSGVVCTNVRYYDNSADGTYSTDNPRQPMGTGYHDLMTLWKAGGYGDYRYITNNIDDYADARARMAYTLSQQLGYRGSMWWARARKYMEARCPRNKIGRIYMLSKTAALPVGSPIENNLPAYDNFVIVFDSVDDIKGIMRDWGVPFTFNPTDAVYNNSDNLPDYTPPGQPSNPSGGGGGGGNNYTDPMITSDPSISNLDVMIHSYAIDRNNLNALSNVLWGETFIADINRLWEDPAEMITSVYLFPFDIQQHDPANVGDLTRLQLGNVTAPEDTRGRPIQGGYNRIIKSEAYTVQPYYNTFLDYEPYSTYELYMPYIGSVQLSAGDIVGHDLVVEYIVSIQTGQATCNVYADRRIIGTYNSQIGIPIALSSSNHYEQKIQIATSAAQMVVTLGAAALTGGASVAATSAGAAGSTAAAAASGSASAAQAAAIRGAASVEAAQTAANAQLASTAMTSAASTGASIMNSSININRGGGYSPDNSLYAPQDIYLMVTRMTPAIPNNYGEQIGYMSSYSGKVENFTGFLQCGNVIGTTSATEAENRIIDELLRGGIYV